MLKTPAKGFESVSRYMGRKRAQNHKNALYLQKARKKPAGALKTGYFDVLRHEAVAQVEAGGGIVDVNVVTPEVDEVFVLPDAVKTIEATDLILGRDRLTR